MTDLVETVEYRMGLSAGQYVQQAAAVDQANEQIVASTTAVATAEERVSVVTQKTGNAFAQLEARGDRLVALEQRRRNAIEQANRVAEEEGVATERLAAHLTALNAKYNAQADALTRVRPGMQQGTATTRQFGSAIQQAGFQVGDFAVQVASGGGILRPLIQQGTQLISMFGPWGAVIGAAGAVVGALAVSFLDLGDSTKEAEEAQKRFNDTLDRAGDLMDEIHGKSERNRASLEAQVRNMAAIARSELANAQRELDTTQQVIVGRAGHAETDPGKAAKDEVRRLQQELLTLNAQLGLYDDGRAKMGQNFSDYYVNQAGDVTKLNMALERELELLKMTESQRAIASDVDKSLGAIGLTRNTATTDQLKYYTDLATAKQRQIDTNKALEKSEKDAEQAAKDAAAEAKRRAKEQADALATLDKSLATLRDRLNPAGAAAASLERDVLTLDLAFDAGKIGIEDYNDAIEKLYSGEYKKLTDAQDAQRRSLDAQRATINMTAEDRAAYLAGIEAENKLLADGKDLADVRSQAYISNAKSLAVETVAHDKMTSRAKANQEVFERFFDQSIDRIGSGITEAFATGQIEVAKLGDIGRAVLSELIQLALQLSVINPLKNWALGQDNPTADDALGGILGGIAKFFGGAGGYSGPAASSIIGTGSGMYPFAGGGIMTGRGPAPLRRYANGGVANSPQLAMFGEGSTPEAYVPLPDGRSIPVTMQGGGRTIVVNAPITIEGSGGTPEQNTDLANKMQERLQRAVEQAVDARIADNQRSNGLLNSGLGFG